MPWLPRTGLWRHNDFLRLWAGETASIFGSFVGRTALVLTAILVLDASPLVFGLLSAADIIPGLVFGLITGVWVDRLPRRPIMIVADIGRAALLVTIPLAYAFDVLTIAQLFVVAIGTGTLSIFFDVAYLSYLPAVVERDHILEGNSKMAASTSVAEIGGFSLAGVLVQALTAPVAILLDAVSFVVSALFIGAIRKPETHVVENSKREGMWTEIREGGRALLGDPILRTLAGATMIMDFSIRAIGAVYLIYVTRELGFEPGVLGFIFAVGGVTSLFGALFAARAARQFGVGPSLVVCLAVLTGAWLLTPAAYDTSLISLGLLVGHQLGDAFWTAYDVNAITLRQSVTPDQVMGRVNAGMRFSGQAAMLGGALAGGVMGEVIGIRETLFICTGGLVIAAGWLASSPVWGAKHIPIVETTGAESAA